MATPKTKAKKPKGEAPQPAMAGHRQKPPSVALDWDQLPDPPRIGRQTQQELISKSALVSWLHKHEWISNVPEPDLGQDFRVEIYERRRSTGLSLNIQHKSAKNIDSYKLKTSPHLSYPIDVKDLLHWRKQTVPVFLVVCDTRYKKERFWIDTFEAIEELQVSDPTWVHQKSVNVRIPLCNRLDAATLPKIRRLLADHFYPTVAQRHKQIKIGVEFNFPATPEGQKKQAAFTKFLDAGHPVTIEKEYIANFRLSEWYEHLYGRQIPDSLTMGAARSRQTFRYRMEVHARDGAVVPAQSLELRVLRSGRHEATLSNKHQKGPLVFTVKMMNYPGRQSVEVAFKLVHAGSTVFETRDALSFMVALAEGGQVQLIETNSGKALSSGPIKMNEQFPLEQIKAQVELIKQLCFLQSRFQFSPALSVRGRYLTYDDFYYANQLYTICQTGRFSTTTEVSFTINVASLHTQQPAWEQAMSTPVKHGLEMRMTAPARITMFGRTIHLGTVQQCAKYTIEQTLSYIEQVKKGLENNLSKIRMTMADTLLEQTYPDWKSDDSMFGFTTGTKQNKHEATVNN